MTARSVSRRVEQGDATRRALMSSARASFGTSGYGSTSIQSIVDDAGVTKGAFYHHFDGKQQIFAKVFEDIHREIGRRAFVVHLDEERSVSGQPRVRDLASEPNSKVFAHLISGCRTYLEAHTRADVQRIVLLDGRAVLSWEEWHRIHNDHSVVLLRADLRRAIRRRILRPLPLSLLATMLAGALNEGCIAIANADDPDDVIADAMSVVAEILEGLRFPPGSG